MNPETLIQLFGSFPYWIAVILIAMLPIAELRLSIPIAILVFEFDPVTAYLLSVFGNMIPVIPLLLFLEPVSNYLRRWHIGDVFFTWLFKRTRQNHNARFEKYGTYALAMFVGVPLPVTGAWTGCAAAFVFGIKFKHSLAAILGGVMLAGLIMTVLTVTGKAVVSM
ncbi:MAG: small multi-drug export protein [Candidatus Methanoperedenaceae archaeon]|nr:small multi-drug export protein [Candidatus Methanoperedenaceae archaeon]MDW7727242.1 small multi-drug export protein [Candidatus Methanoperedens sp.]